jgi:hypothetical protein
MAIDVEFIGILYFHVLDDAGLEGSPKMVGKGTHPAKDFHCLGLAMD